VEIRKNGSNVLLWVELVGPSTIDGPVKVALSIRNDKRRPGSVGGRSADEINAHVWGPYCFRPGIDGGSPDGRTAAPVQLTLGEGRLFALESTTRPSWQPQEVPWDYTGKPLRLTLTCSRDGYRQWVIPEDVKPA
jgi:hypothetical protein